MKLRKLNAAIDAAPAVYGMTKWGPVEFKKGSLKARLAASFTGTQETGVCVDDDGVLCADPATVAPRR